MVKITDALQKLGWKLPMTIEFIEEWLPKTIWHNDTTWALQVDYLITDEMDVYYVDTFEYTLYGMRAERLFETKPRKDHLSAYLFVVYMLIRNEYIIVDNK
jgi:hypothetical protein